MTEQNGLGRSSATDELRRMLDERGVEYTDRDMFGKHVFHWGAPLHGAMFTDAGEWTELVVENAAPEQAIAATLGRGTCHVKAAKKIGDSFGFSLSCGHSMVNPFNDHPDYCPWCGAEVVDE